MQSDHGYGNENVDRGNSSRPCHLDIYKERLFSPFSKNYARRHEAPLNRFARPHENAKGDSNTIIPYRAWHFCIILVAM